MRASGGCPAGWAASLVVVLVSAVALVSCRSGPTNSPHSTAPLHCPCGAEWTGKSATCGACGHAASRECPACHQMWPPETGSAGRCPLCGATIDVEPGR